MSDLSPPSRQLSRRRLLGTSAGAVGALSLTGGLTGCAGAVGADRLDYWHLMSGGDGIRMGDMVKAINARNLGFAAKQTVLAWGPPYYTKLAMASVGGKAPDVAIMHATRVAGYAPGGLLDPWDLDLLAEFGVTEDKFPSRVWEKGTYEGKVYSISLDSHPFIFMYNTDVAEKAGLLASSGQLAEITSPEQFLEAGKKMAEATGVHGFSYGYLADGAQMWRMFYTFYRQQNAEFLLEPGQPAVVDMDAGVKSLEFIISMLDDTITASTGDGGTAVSEFAAGKSGALFSGVWETPTMRKAGIPFDASTIPNLFGTPAAYADSHAFVLPHQDQPGKMRRAAYQFIAEMLQGSYSWAEAGHIPAFNPVVESAEYAKLLPQAHYANAAEIINYDPVAWYTGSGSNFQSYFAEAIQGVLMGRTPPAAGLQGFIDRLDTLQKQPNPVGQA